MILLVGRANNNIVISWPAYNSFDMCNAVTHTMAEMAASNVIIMTGSEILCEQKPVNIELCVIIVNNKGIQNSAISSTAPNRIVARLYTSTLVPEHEMVDVRCACGFLIKVTRENSVTLTLRQQRRRPCSHHHQQQQQYRPVQYSKPLLW